MITGVDHVQVAAPPGSEDVARAFYGDALGMRELPKPPELAARGGVWFAAGAHQLHVGIDAHFAPARKAHPALAVEDLPTLAARLADHGHTVDHDGPRAYVDDPFGNRVELVAAHVEVTVRSLRDDERAWAAAFLHDFWGGESIVFDDGREHRPAELPTLVADVGGERTGIATYAIAGDAGELVTLNAFASGRGVGGALVEGVVEAARAAGCASLRVTTTNANLPALRLYQRHGFVIDRVLPGAIERARLRKPAIPPRDSNGIPIRDEVELERVLGA